MKIEFWFVDNKIHRTKLLTWFSWVIQLFSWWNHLAIRIITEHEDYFIHAQWRVVRQEFQEFVTAADRMVVVKVPLQDWSHRLPWLHKQLGKHYDVPAIFLQLVYQLTGLWCWFPAKKQTFWFCSEIGAAMLERPRPEKYSPENLADCQELVTDRLLMTRKGIGVEQLRHLV